MDDTIDKAIRVCTNKLKVNPQDWNARAFLGRCYLKKGMMQEARKEFEEAVKTISDNKVIFKLLADIYESEGRTKEAKWIYRIYSSMDIEDSKADSSLHAIKTDEPVKKEEKTTQKAKEPLIKEKKHEKTEKKEEEKPKEKKKISTTTIADIYLNQGYTDKALSIYREILAKDPTNTEIQEKINSITKKKEDPPPLKQMESPDDLEMSLHAIKTDDIDKKEAISDLKVKKPVTKEAKEPVIKEKKQDKTEKREEFPPLKQTEPPDDLKDIETQKEITPIAKRKKEETSPPRKVESPEDLKNKMVIATLNRWLDNLQRGEGRSI